MSAEYKPERWGPVPETLIFPWKWKTPRAVTTDDLFGPAFSDKFIAAVFGIMSVTQDKHTFRVVTRHPDRMRAWFAWVENLKQPWPKQGPPSWYCRHEAREQAHGDVRWMPWTLGVGADTWPLPNVTIEVAPAPEAP